MLAIEAALSVTFNSRYGALREYIKPRYSFWQRQCPPESDMNDHGWDHIDRVLVNLDALLGPKPLESLSEHEIFLAMASILYHDVGMLGGRTNHPDTSGNVAEKDAGLLGLLNDAEITVVALASRCHGSHADIETIAEGLPEFLVIGGDRVYPRVIAAVVRLADELDEDERRAPANVQDAINLAASAAGTAPLAPASQFFWRFCQRISGIEIDFGRKEIFIDAKLQPGDLVDTVLKDGKSVSFVVEMARKLEKINTERRKVNLFLADRPGLRYQCLRVQVRSGKYPPEFKPPTTVFFFDGTTADTFFGAFMPLVSSKLGAILLDGLRQMQSAEFEKAIDIFTELEKKTEAFGRFAPPYVETRLLYNYMCAASRWSESALGDRKLALLDQAEQYFKRWLDSGHNGKWADLSLLPENELYRFQNDGDVVMLLGERGTRLKSIVESYGYRLDLKDGNLVTPQNVRRPAGGGGGCVAHGTRVARPDGTAVVESLRVGDEILAWNRVRAHTEPRRVLRIWATRGARAVQINGNLVVSEAQPVLCPGKGWTTARSLTLDDRLADGSPIMSINMLAGYFDFYDIEVDHPDHAYATAPGAILHNKMYLS